MTEQNSTQVVQKMLWAVMSDITVKNILTSELMMHKLMFKLSKSDIIFKISETEKVNINSLQTFCYSMFFTHSSVQEQLWRLKKVKYQHWLTLCRILSKNAFFRNSMFLYSRWLFAIDWHQWSKDCASWHLWECWDSNWLIEVLQFLLIVEKVSQLMILDMSYQAATSMMTQSDLFDIVNIEISSHTMIEKWSFRLSEEAQRSNSCCICFQRLNSRRKRLMSNKTDVVSCHYQSEYQNSRSRVVSQQYKFADVNRTNSQVWTCKFVTVTTQSHSQSDDQKPQFRQYSTYILINCFSYRQMCTFIKTMRLRIWCFLQSGPCAYKCKTDKVQSVDQADLSKNVQFM
jgi:hypothetical protein